MPGGTVHGFVREGNLLLIRRLAVCFGVPGESPALPVRTSKGRRAAEDFFSCACGQASNGMGYQRTIGHKSAKDQSYKGETWATIPQPRCGRASRKDDA